MERKTKVKPKTCVNCAHVIHDETWGEYKCKLRQIRMLNPDQDLGCKHYKRITNKK